MRTIPVDSTDAREQRELEAEQAAQALADAQARDRAHAEVCRSGWLGVDVDDRPIPCTRCRPHLEHAACSTCSTSWAACTTIRAQRRGACCDTCRHGHRRGDR